MDIQTSTSFNDERVNEQLSCDWSSVRVETSPLGGRDVSVPGAQLAWDMSRCTQWPSGLTAEENQKKILIDDREKRLFFYTGTLEPDSQKQS